MDDDLNDGTPLHPPYCERVRLLLSLHLDGEATPDQQVEAEAHVATCTDCRIARDTDRAVREHLERAFAALPTGTYAGSIRQLVEADLRSTRAANRFLLLSAAAAALVAVGLGLHAGLGPRGGRGVVEPTDLLDQARVSTRFVVSAPALDAGR